MKVEAKKVDVLQRLVKYDLEQCTNWGVSAPKHGDDAVFNVALVVRPELVDVPITVIIKQGIKAAEAVEALDFVAEIIMDADKNVVKHNVTHKREGLGYWFWLGMHTRALVAGLFGLPNYLISWLIGKVKGEQL